MRWLRLARKDLRDAVRERTLLVTAGVFVLVGGLVGYAATGSGGPEEVGRLLPPLLLGTMTLLVPLVALGTSYESIVGPRTDGSLQFLLGLPYSRRDVLVGAYAAQACLVCASVLAGFAALVLVALARGVVVSPAATVIVLFLATVLGVVFVALGVGISAAVRSTQAAGALVFGVFVLLFFFWAALPGLIAYALNGFAPAPTPGWAPAFRALNPVAAVQVLGDALLARWSANPVGGSLAGDTLDSAPVAALVLAGWATLVPLAGYLRFRSDDL